MEAITRSGKRIHGKIADILIRKGVATPIREDEEVIPDRVKKMTTGGGVAKTIVTRPRTKPAPKKKAPAKRKPTAKKK